MKLKPYLWNYIIFDGSCETLERGENSLSSKVICER